MTAYYGKTTKLTLPSSFSLAALYVNSLAASMSVSICSIQETHDQCCAERTKP